LAATIDAAFYEGHGCSPESGPAIIGLSSGFRHVGQYQGAGVVTGLGLLLRHLAQRKRLPLTAVFGRTFLPDLKTFFAMTTPYASFRSLRSFMQVLAAFATNLPVWSLTSHSM